MKITNICFVAGVGGHTEQMQRLATKLNKSCYNFYHISDSGKPKFDGISVGEVRDKQTGSIINPLLTIKRISAINRFLKRSNVDCIISLGPGVSLLVYLVSRWRGIRFLHIESWSRFYSLSLTTKLLAIFRCEIWVQNRILCERFKQYNFTLIGRL